MTTYRSDASMAGSNEGSIEELRGKHRRLAILRVLSRLPQYKANLRLLQDYLELVALPAELDVVRDDLRRLKDIGLLEVNERHEACPVTLTERGLDVADGTALVDIVRRPSPDEPY